MTQSIIVKRYIKKSKDIFAQDQCVKCIRG